MPRNTAWCTVGTNGAPRKPAECTGVGRGANSLRVHRPAFLGVKQPVAVQSPAFLGILLGLAVVPARFLSMSLTTTVHRPAFLGASRAQPVHPLAFLGAQLAKPVHYAGFLGAQPAQLVHHTDFLGISRRTASPAGTPRCISRQVHGSDGTRPGISRPRRTRHGATFAGPSRHSGACPWRQGRDHL